MANRRPLWPILIAAFGMPALYVASFGPACWAVGRGYWNADHAAILFRPLAVLTWKGPAPVAGLLSRIAGMTEIGAADGLGEVQYAAGYRDVFGGSRVYRIQDLVVYPLGGAGIAPSKTPLATPESN